jgi:hypothetical protein
MSKLAKFKEFALTKEEQSKIVGGWVCWVHLGGGVMKGYLIAPSQNPVTWCDTKQGCVLCNQSM